MLVLGDACQLSDQDKIVVQQSLRNGNDKNQTSALAPIVPWNSSAAAANRESDLIDQLCAGMRKGNAIFGQGGVSPFADQHLCEKICGLYYALRFSKKTDDLT